jgi:type II secretory pathway component PulL
VEDHGGNHPIVDLKQHFDELDGAVTYQVQAPQSSPVSQFQTKLSYTKLVSEHSDTLKDQLDISPSW